MDYLCRRAATRPVVKTGGLVSACSRLQFTSVVGPLSRGVACFAFYNAVFLANQKKPFHLKGEKTLSLKLKSGAKIGEVIRSEPDKVSKHSSTEGSLVLTLPPEKTSGGATTETSAASHIEKESVESLFGGKPVPDIP